MTDSQTKLMLILKHGSLNDAELVWHDNTDLELLEMGWTKEEIAYVLRIRWVGRFV